MDRRCSVLFSAHVTVILIRTAPSSVSQAEADETNLSDDHFVVDQLLQLAALLDFSDEAGRRVMAEVTQCVWQRCLRPSGAALCPVLRISRALTYPPHS
jgi:hypothetical protein